MTRPRVLLADDHSLLLEAFARLLADDFDIVAMVSDGEQLVDAAARLVPDVIVSDVSMPRMGGLAAARRLRDQVPGSRIVFLTVNEDALMAAEAFRLGASAWVLKSATAAELVRAVRQALDGHRFLSRGIVGGDIAALPDVTVARSLAEDLTPREREVLRLLAQGLVMKQVAAELGITTRTVAFHKYRVMQQLGVTSNAELVQFAMRNNLT